MPVARVAVIHIAMATLAAMGFFFASGCYTAAHVLVDYHRLPVDPPELIAAAFESWPAVWPLAWKWNMFPTMPPGRFWLVHGYAYVLCIGSLVLGIAVSRQLPIEVAVRKIAWVVMTVAMGFYFVFPAFIELPTLEVIDQEYTIMWGSYPFGSLWLDSLVLFAFACTCWCILEVVGCIVVVRRWRKRGLG